MLKALLAKHSIPLSDARGQGYDNALNMTGKKEGLSTHILKENPLAKLCTCGAHSLNLCGDWAVQSCTEAVTFFGVVQKTVVIFGGSPARWELLKGIIHNSLHPASDTRWSAQILSVKPFAGHNPGLRVALGKLRENFKLTPEAKADVDGILKYLKSFKCILLSSIWFKALTMIDYRSKILQLRNATLDIEVQSIDGLVSDLTDLKTQWKKILHECTEVWRALSNIGQSDIDESEEISPRSARELQRNSLTSQTLGKKIRNRTKNRLTKKRSREKPKSSDVKFSMLLSTVSSKK